MCTVSWIHHSPDALELLCNRDERLDRAPAQGPAIESAQGISYLAPRDTAAGGTWLAANEFGLVLALLNLPLENAGPAFARPSRGTLIPRLIHHPTPEAAVQAAAQFDLAPFAPFQLLFLQPGCTARVLEWHPPHLSRIADAESIMLLVSSSYDQRGVEIRRRAEFADRIRDAEGQVNSDLLHTFHGSHLGGDFAYAPCMHRDGYATVSFSRVQVNARQIQFFYSPSAPCDAQPGFTRGFTRTMTRRSAAQAA